MHKINLYDCIHLAGIWIRDIRFKSNIQMTQVNKIVKNLESKKLIKAVKSVAVSILIIIIIIIDFYSPKIILF